MPLVDINRPEVIKFLNETYDKTARLRMKWNNLYGENLKAAATLQREEKGYIKEDVDKAQMAAGMATITRDYKSGAPNRRLRPIRDGVHIPTTKTLRKGHSIVDIGLGDPKVDPRLARPDNDLHTDPVMRPVDPEQTKIIYKGIPFYGREPYLKERFKMNPEDKFYFAECESWEYGWRLKDSYFGRAAPKFGRVWRLYRDVRCRSGAQPDPDHYKSSEAPGPNKCSPTN